MLHRVFAYMGSALPILASLATSVTDTTAGDAIRATGSNLSSATVKVGGTSAVVTSNTAGAVTCTAPALATLAPKPACPSFDGVDDRLGSSFAISQLFGSGLSFVAVLDLSESVVPTLSGSGIDYDAHVFCDAAAWFGLRLYRSGSVIKAGYRHYNGAPNETPLVNVPGRVCILRGKWTGTEIFLALDNEPFGAGTLTGAPGTISNVLRVGTNWNQSTFFGFRLIELLFAPSALSDATFTDIVAYANQQHGLNLSGVAPSSFDPATLNLSGWWRAGGYSSAGTATFTGRASAGASGGRDLTEATNKPAASTSPWPGVYPVVVTTSAGASNALWVEYWSPRYVTGCDCYLDARKGTTLSGTDVTQWADQGPHALLFGSYGAPTLVPNVFGGLPAVRFTPQNALLNAGGERLLPNGKGFFAVAKWTSAIATPSLPYTVPLSIVGDTSGAWTSFGASAGSIALVTWNGTGTLHYPTTGGSGLNDGQARLIGATSDTAPNIRFYAGTTQLGSTVALAGGYTANKYTSIGNTYTVSDGFDGDVGAIFVFDGPPTAAERSKLNEWARSGFPSVVT